MHMHIAHQLIKSPPLRAINRPVYSLIVINKAGGLIYQRDFQPEGSPAILNKLTTNDYLVLAGTFHGIHAITKQITPRFYTTTTTTTTTTAPASAPARPGSSSPATFEGARPTNTPGHASSPSGVAAAVAANVFSPTANVFNNLTKSLDRTHSISSPSQQPISSITPLDSPSITSGTPSASSSAAAAAAKQAQKKPTYTYPNPAVKPSGLEVLETAFFKITCFQTVTGTKFLLFTDRATLSVEVEVMMAKVYELYADYVMKNPFYSLEMPVRCDGFDRGLATVLRGRV
ncbi:Sybindin-like protein [Ascosphaera apis ARSEF 7405]|uniref:Sybindin-like protein n=1 Tax=Ascosphaera apis ARSEF 7405 TaxID=392613 RepID=A0A167WH30_9EURO|nr:Sybindin-like protein [Ascosphaera apis ARSEF 7405]